MIVYVVAQPWTNEVLLLDGTWGDYIFYEDRIEVFTCRVSANRRAAKVDGTVLPWETPEIESMDARADSPRPQERPDYSGQSKAGEPRSAGLF